jgi:hypothetical protein
MSPQERKYYENFDSLDRYVPTLYSTKFFRYELADFDFEKAEALREVTFDKLTELKWMRRVRNQMKIDALPKT